MRKEILRAVALSMVAFSGLTLAACSSDDGGNGDVGDTDASGDGSVQHPDAGNLNDATTHPDTGGGQDHPDATVPDSSQPDSSQPDAYEPDAADAATAVDAADAADAADVNIPDTNVPDTNVPDTNVPDSAPAPVGSACTPENTIQSQACGLCGTQQRVCLTTPGGDTGGPVWQNWGACQGQPTGGCAPGTQTTESCGNCGHRLKVCQLDCSWAVGSCTGEPDNACTPGTTNYVPGLSCDTGGRRQTCTSSCTWGSFGACEGEFTAGTLAIPTTTGNTASVTQTLAATPLLTKLNTGTCPVTISSTKTSFAYTVVSNPTSQTAKVSVWGSPASGGGDIDTILGVYAGSNLPTTDSDRKACMASVNDTCSGSPCSGGFGGLINSSAVTIPANGSIVVYTAAYFAGTTGNFTLNARTDSLQ